MADEGVTVEAPPEQPEITVEIAEDDTGKVGKPELSDEEVSKLSEPPAEDEIGRYAQQAQRRIKSLQIANQELRRREVRAGKDLATASNLAEQLYKENQTLKQNVSRSETALIDQALLRAESQLGQAQNRFRQALAANNPDEIAAANVEVARYVAEADRLRLLKPAPSKDPDSATAGTPGAAAAPPPAAPPPSPATQAWVQKNPWFNRPGEERMTSYAMFVHNELQAQGITEANGTAYWGAIDKELREKFPERFGSVNGKESKEPKESGGRPVTVTGATRVNGQAQTTPRAPRHVVLSESQVRIARALDLTPEQYAAQLVKEEQAKERIQ